MASSAPKQIGDDQVKAIAGHIRVLLEKTAMSPDYAPSTQIEGESDSNMEDEGLSLSL